MFFSSFRKKVLRMSCKNWLQRHITFFQNERFVSSHFDIVRRFKQVGGIMHYHALISFKKSFQRSKIRFKTFPQNEMLVNQSAAVGEQLIVKQLIVWTNKAEWNGEMLECRSGLSWRRLFRVPLWLNDRFKRRRFHVANAETRSRLTGHRLKVAPRMRVSCQI